MRLKYSDDVEKARVHTGKLASKPGDGYGLFMLRHLCVLVSNGTHRDAEDWEHVSVSTQGRPPTWTEMSYIKHLFWDDDETVVEFHPPRSVYINCHPYCLHLWRHRVFPFPLPPPRLVGPLSARSHSSSAALVAEEPSEPADLSGPAIRPLP